ncbi:hypothetical protein [Parenemella sanctibonifatiensis]|nr:hypothetical protein [Parenemella sanctibonifatiensis]
MATSERPDAGDDRVGGPDPGMRVKMDTRFLPLRRVLTGEPADEDQLAGQLAFVQARLDCADFRVANLLAALLLDDTGRGRLSEDQREQIVTTVLGFRYWLDEPGVDGMCLFSENHQILFASCDYLAGQLHPARVFSNDGRSGAEHRDRAAIRVRQWLGRRWQHGFSEWLSNTYYEEHIAAVALLAGFAADDDIRAQATGVLDLLLLDLALHSWTDGQDRWFIPSSGRCYAPGKQAPGGSAVADIMRWAFGPGEVQDQEWATLSAILFASGYEVPEQIRAIAHDRDGATIDQAMGLELAEAAALREPAPLGEVETRGTLWWAMEAFTTPESIVDTMRAFRAWRMKDNPFLTNLTPFAKLPEALLPGLIRILNPATQGVALERARVRTRRTPHWLLSSAQRYRPGGYGDQQHLWTALLPRGVTVFATHPGGAMFDDVARNFSPGEWVGNGINPDVVQHGRVLIAFHHLGVRSGYLEPKRRLESHLWWPRTDFDETQQGQRWVAGRIGSAYIGVRSWAPLEFVSRNEIRQPGKVTVWVVLMGDAETYADLAEFAAEVAAIPVVAGDLPDNRHLMVWADGHRHDLTFGGAHLIDGEPVILSEDRYASRFVTAERGPERIDVGGHVLTAAGREQQ